MNEFNQTALVTKDPAAVAAAEGAKARIQSAYIMALNKPRNEDQARDRILEACKRPAFAERVEFSKPVSGKSIKGPSIRFAELALREWTNIMADTQTLYEDSDMRRVRVSVLDLETNAQFCKEIQVKKTVERKNPAGHEVVSDRLNTKGEKVYIVIATDDELHNKEAALISKALRNEGLRIIPSDITDEALETARKTLRDRDAKDPKASKKKILDSFSSVGIKPKEIEKYLKHSVDTLSPAELEELRGMYTAIKEGSASWAEYINPSEKEENENENTGADDLTEAIKGNTTEKPPVAPGSTQEEKVGDSPPLRIDHIRDVFMKHQKIVTDALKAYEMKPDKTLEDGLNKMSEEDYKKLNKDIQFAIKSIDEEII